MINKRLAGPLSPSPYGTPAHAFGDAGYHYVLSDSEEGSGQLVDVEHVSVSANPPHKEDKFGGASGEQD
ncbi:hypothetical protein QYF36_012022 [Acer negundo]|nr:hypothetical protein QYF36_012022 [Acer negundo]